MLKDQLLAKQFHLDSRVYNKINAFSDKEREIYFMTKKERKQLENAARKMALLNEVRALYKKVGSMRKVASIIGISRKTVSNYLDENFSASNSQKGNKKTSIIDPYKCFINEQIEKGLRERGYNGSSSTIRHFISNKKKENEIVKEKSSIKYEYVDRSTLLKLLYKRIDKVPGLTESTLQKVYQREPSYKKIILLVDSFRELMKLKKIDLLDTWIKDASNLQIDEINSFINGMLRDIDAVKNAIIYDYNNGLTEGKVNKVKVTKRIMYGRCGFELLKKKSLRLEFWH